MAASFGDLFAIVKRTWATMGRLHVVNIVRDRYLTKPPGVLGRRTGTLVRSITSESSADDDSFTVGTSVVYGVGWELGFTRPSYIIRAKNARALAIPTPGGVIYRKSAQIPAKTFAARPFLQPGLEESYPYLQETAENLISDKIAVAFPDRVIVVGRA